MTGYYWLQRPGLSAFVAGTTLKGNSSPRASAGSQLRLLPVFHHSPTSLPHFPTGASPQSPSWVPPPGNYRCEHPRREAADYKPRHCTASPTPPPPGPPSASPPVPPSSPATPVPPPPAASPVCQSIMSRKLHFIQLQLYSFGQLR